MSIIAYYVIYNAYYALKYGNFVLLYVLQRIHNEIIAVTNGRRNPDVHPIRLKPEDEQFIQTQWKLSNLSMNSNILCGISR